MIESFLAYVSTSGTDTYATQPWRNGCTYAVREVQYNSLMPISALTLNGNTQVIILPYSYKLTFSIFCTRISRFNNPTR